GFLEYDGGTLVIYGQNGAGKSLLLESIESALTGRLVGRTEPNGDYHFNAITTALLVRGDLSRIYVDDTVGDMRPADLQSAVALVTEEEVDALDLPEKVLAAWRGLLRAVTDKTHALLA